MEGALALCRFAHFLAAMVLFGASLYVRVLAPPDLAQALAPAARRIAIGAIPVIALSALAWLALEAASMSGDWRGVVDADALQGVLFNTAFGQVWQGRLLLAAGAGRGAGAASARALDPDAHALRAAASEPRTRRSRGDANGRARRAASPQPRAASARRRRVARRTADVRALPQGLSRSRAAPRRGHRDATLFRLGTIRCGAGRS